MRNTSAKPSALGTRLADEMPLGMIKNNSPRSSALKTCFWAGTALTLIYTTPVFAQSAGDNEPGAADIIVTARRVEERLQDVPISITVYNQEQISNRNIVSSVDLATYTPSLAVNTRFGAEKAFFALRGFTQEPNTAPSVGVYFADVVAPRLALATGGGNGAGVGSLMDVKDIQVLKGPQGTLFGRNTTGGAILIVPQKPTDNLEGSIEGTLGNYDARRVQAVLNVPIADSFRVRVAVDRNKRDGYLNNRFDMGGVGPSDFADTNYIAARLSVVADLSPDFENYMIFTYSSSDTNGTVGRPAVCYRGTPGAGPLDGANANPAIRAAECAALDLRTTKNAGFYDITNSYADAYEKQRQVQFINTTTWKASDTLTVKNIISYSEMRQSSNTNIEGDAIATPFAVLTRGINGPTAEMSTFTEELQLQGGSAGNKLIWQLGGYVETSDPIGTPEQYSAIFGSGCTDISTFRCAVGTTISDMRVGSHYRDYAFYAQATYKITDQLSLTGGARYTWDRLTGFSDNLSVAASPDGPIVTSTRPSCTQATNQTPTDPAIRANLLNNKACLVNFAVKSQKPTWLISLDYKPTEDILLYGKYARGYRAGGFNPQSYSPNPAASPPYWGPEKVDTYEAGFKTSWRGGGIKGTFNVAAFYNFFSQQQLTVNLPNCNVGPALPLCLPTHPLIGINGIFNAGTSHIKGIEVESSLELFEGFQVEAGYTYLDAKVVKTNVPACDPGNFNCAAASFPATGERIPLSPKNRVTATATYRLPLPESIGKVSIAATFTHTDSQFFSHNDDHAFANGFIPFNPSHLPSTDLLNVNFNWRDIGGLPVDVALFATNVTKEKYWVASTNALGSTGADFIQVGQPRMGGIRVKYRFGS